VNDNETALILDKLIDHERRLSKELNAVRVEAEETSNAAFRAWQKTEDESRAATANYDSSVRYTQSLTYTRLHLSLIDYTLEDLEK
jgi:hypothetical protein